MDTIVTPRRERNGLLPTIGLNRRRPRRNGDQQPNRQPPPPPVDQALKGQLNKVLLALEPRIRKLAATFPEHQQELVQAQTGAQNDVGNDRLQQAKTAVMELADRVGGLERESQSLEAEMKDRLKRLAASLSHANKLAAASGGQVPQAVSTGRNQVIQLAQETRFGPAIAGIKRLENDLDEYLRSFPPQALLQTAMDPVNVATPKDVFRDEDRKRIDKATDRGGVKGHGEFKKILTAWSDVQKHPEQPAKLTKLESLVLEYLQTHGEEPKDEIATNKRAACHEILDKLRELAAFRLRDEYDQLVKNGGGDPEQQRALHIKLLATGKGVRVPDGKGASDSFFLSDPTGRPAYIFKPMQGENEVEGFPKGGGAAREVMLSKLNERIKQRIPGLDFGVCPTTVMELESSSFATTEGNLGSREAKRIGAVQSTATCDGDLAKYIGTGATVGGEIAPEEVRRRRASIPVDDVQKIAVLDFLTLNLDRNPGNLLFKTQPNGSVRLIPIDAGNALPSRETFEQKSMALGGQPLPSDRLLGDSNALMALEQAQQPFSRTMIDMLEQLDPAVLKQDAQEEYEGLGRAHGAFDGMIDPSTFGLMERSAAFLKRACRRMTPFEMSIAYSVFFGEILEARQEDLENVIDGVIEKAKVEAERTLYQTEYVQRFKEIPDAAVSRIKSVDTRAFHELNSRVAQFCRQGDFKSACALLDDLKQEALRVLELAAQDPQAAIRAYLDTIRYGGMSFEQLLQAANNVPASQEQEVVSAHKEYHQKKSKYEELLTKTDLDATLVAAHWLAGAAETLLRRVGQL